MMDTLRSAVVNGFHDGFTFVDLPIPPGGIDIEVTALENEPSPVNLDATDVQRLSGSLEWVAAGMAVSCWRGLHELSAEANQQ
ncbi:MAG TPA: hypothetical protein VF120_14900 [Ktedonobacterales bacterium]